MKKLAVAGILILLVGFIVYSGSLFDKKLALSAAINSFLDFSTSSKGQLRERIRILEGENERLRNTLSNAPEGDNEDIKVYSSYPFNNRGEIAIAAGRDKGIHEGDAVVYGGNILVGKVRDVFESSSVVTTIFDPSWEVQVRIGESEIDALMQGGNELRVVLIPDDAPIEKGEIVVVASEEFPYGLEVGVVGDIENVSGDVFKEAVLTPSLQLNNVRNVSIYR
jgi:rod shape-determining protein MreC